MSIWELSAAEGVAVPVGASSSVPPRVAPPLAVMAPDIRAVPFTSNVAVGVIVPMPRLLPETKMGESAMVDAL